MSLSTVLSGGYAFVRRCIWKMYWWAMCCSRVARLTSPAVAPFSYLAADHPLAPAVERFREAIATRGLDVSRARVHTDLTLRPTAGGGLGLHRAYWSLQRSGPDGFAATTLDYRAKGDRATWLEFPEDPRLPALGDLSGTVLRYMPLRRCTARADGAVGKVKRPRRAAEAWALLGAVNGALGDG